MRLSLFFFIICASSSLAQNLVPNPNFEDTVYCPDPPNGIIGNHLAVKEWFCPTIIHPNGADYFNSCSPPPFNLPTIGASYQEDPSFGNGFVGLCNYLEFVPPYAPMICEYIQVKLLDTLQQGQSYYVHFLFNYRDYLYTVCKNVGIRFSDDTLFHISPPGGTLGFDSLRTLEDTTLVSVYDSISWFSFDTTYIAQGGEEFITIGNFRDINTSSLIKLNGSYPSYVFIDNVYVSPLPPVIGCMDSTACTYIDSADINDTNMCIYPPEVSISDNSGSNLEAITNTGNSLLWSTGETTTTIIPDTNDTYWVIANNGICESDTAWIEIDWVKTDYVETLQTLPKKLSHILDPLGRKEEKKSNTIQFLIYDDGTVEKRIVVE
jgi:hypothetical protein